MKRQILSLLALIFISSQANALFEIRAGYGVTTPSDDSYSGSTLNPMSGFNVDGIVELPMVPVGLGLRYENMGFEVDAGALGTYDSDMERLSLLVNYRIIDFFFYLGAIATVGFSNDVSIKTALGSFDYDADLTYTVGAEGGLSLGLFMVGAELGYNFANFEEKTGTLADANFDGVYGKILVGVGF